MSYPEDPYVAPAPLPSTAEGDRSIDDANETPKDPSSDSTIAAPAMHSSEQPESSSAAPREPIIYESALTETFPSLPEIPLSTGPPDPAWNGWDVVRLTCITLVALFVGVFAVLFVARVTLYPHHALGEIARNPLIAVAGQSLAYILVLLYMYVMVTRERRRPDFFQAIHWNWPSKIAIYIVTGVVLSIALQGLAHFLPIPKELPIDSFFQTPAEAWSLGLLSITLAPLMEELYFRGFLYPVLARRLGLVASVLITATAFALLHGAQLQFSGGALLVIFLVGLVLTVVRAKTNSVAAGLVIHMAYNATITLAMFAATDGFRHLEKLNQ